VLAIGRRARRCGPHRGSSYPSSLQRAGISIAAAELLFGRITAKIDGMCAERDRPKKEQLVTG
jgi:hypothetical protein